MSQTRQEELQWQQCTLAISTERSTSHPLVGVPMIMNPAISRANIMQQQSEYGRAPFHFFVTPMDLIQTAVLFQRICASCGHLKCEHSRQGCFFNVGIGKCNFHAFAKCNVKNKEDHARFGMESGYCCQIGHWQGGQWLYSSCNMPVVRMVVECK